MNFAFSTRRSTGSALIAVYWSIAILSTAIVSTAMLLMVEMNSSAQRQLAILADAHAERGLAIAMHPEIDPGDPLLISGPASDEEGYQATIRSESARLNLNALLARDQRRPIEDLWVLWGMEREAAVDLVDRLLDWVDPDSRTEGRGAERRDYLAMGLDHMPYNRQFLSLDEVALVPGFEIVSALRPDWREAFTLWGDGLLDLGDAEPDVIAAACRCPIEIAAAFVEERRGPDGLENTKDDLPLDSVEAVLLRLGAAEDTAALVTLGSTAVRLDSIGWIQNVRVRRTAIFGARGPGAEMLDFERRRL